MKEDKKDVLLKIKKLLVLTDKKSNAAIGETVNAMSLAQKLLLKHHLSMSQVLAIGDENQNESDLIDVKEEESVSFKANAVPKWMMNIIIAVNKITQTKALIRRLARDKKSLCELKIIFIGDSFDVLTASELFNFLRNSVTRLATKHQNEINGKYKNWRSFSEGCSDAILSRSNDIEMEIKRKVSGFKNSIGDLDISNFELNEDDYDIADDNLDELFSDSSSLMLYMKYEDVKFKKINEYLENKDFEYEQCSSTISRVDGDSYTMGIIAGKKIPLKVTKQVKEKSKNGK